MRNNLWNRGYYYSTPERDFKQLIYDVVSFYISYLNYSPNYVETEVWHHSGNKVSIILNVDDYVSEFFVSGDDYGNRNISPIKKNIKRCCDKIKKQKLILSLAGIE